MIRSFLVLAQIVESSRASHPVRPEEMMRAFALTTLSLTALAASLVGCAAEDYYCDATGCYYCDGLGCRAVDPPDRTTCRGDFECRSGTVCTDAGCVDVCEVADTCPDGTECRDGLCVGPTEPDPEPNPGSCERTEDCLASGLVCLDGICTPDDSVCDENTDCGSGELCIDGECLAGDERCQFDHECGADRVCINARCAAGCDADNPCPSGQACEDRVCRDEDPPTGECTRNVDCGEGGVCEDSTCREGCSGDAECGEGRYCKSGVCRVDRRPRPFCSDNSDCEPGHPCVGGVCRTPCETHRQCLMFDVQFNFCLDNFCATTNEATSNCSTVDDCDAGEDCRDGICR